MPEAGFYERGQGRPSPPLFLCWCSLEQRPQSLEESSAMIMKTGFVVWLCREANYSLFFFFLTMFCFAAEYFYYFCFPAYEISPFALGLPGCLYIC